MGCFAAIPALRIARGLLLNPLDEGAASRADIIHRELCTLHLNPLDHSPEQLVVQSLFADGHIRYSMAIDEETQSGKYTPGLEILALQEEIIPGSLREMVWGLSDFGFRMTLSCEVPGIIAANLPAFLARLFRQGRMDYDHLKTEAVFAVHPGGPKIVDSVRELLELEDKQLATSRAILFERGNMSSATLPHIWARIVETGGVASGTVIVSLGFGPGLTIAGALLRKR
jgi:predicted naringenin-chalcone synthase